MHSSLIESPSYLLISIDNVKSYTNQGSNNERFGKKNWIGDIVVYDPFHCVFSLFLSKSDSSIFLPGPLSSKSFSHIADYVFLRHWTEFGDHLVHKMVRSTNQSLCTKHKKVGEWADSTPCTTSASDWACRKNTTSGRDPVLLTTSYLAKLRRMMISQ